MKYEFVKFQGDLSEAVTYHGGLSHLVCVGAGTAQLEIETDTGVWERPDNMLAQGTVDGQRMRPFELNQGPRVRVRTTGVVDKVYLT